MVSERRNRDWRIGAMELVQMRLIRKYLLDFLFPLLWRHRQRKGIPFEFCPFKEFLETGSAHRNAELNFSLFKLIKEFSKGKTRWNMIVEIKWAFWMRSRLFWVFPHYKLTKTWVVPTECMTYFPRKHKKTLAEGSHQAYSIVFSLSFLSRMEFDLFLKSIAVFGVKMQ